MQGQDQVSGLPRPVTLTTGEMVEALQDPLKQVIETCRRVLEKTPPELVSDIIDRGVALCGGGALLRGIDKLLTKALGIPAYLVDNPTTCVVEGRGQSAGDVHHPETQPAVHIVIFLTGSDAPGLLLGGRMDNPEIPARFLTVMGLGARGEYFPVKKWGRLGSLAACILFLAGSVVVMFVGLFNAYQAFQQHGTSLLDDTLGVPLVIAFILFLIGVLAAWITHVNWDKAVVAYERGFAYSDRKGVQTWPLGPGCLDDLRHHAPLHQRDLYRYNPYLYVG